MVVGGEADLSNECLGQGSVDSIAEEEWGDVLRDGCAIPGDDEGPVAFDGAGRSVGGGSGWFGGFGGLPGGYLCPG